MVSFALDLMRNLASLALMRFTPAGNGGKSSHSLQLALIGVPSLLATSFRLSHESLTRLDFVHDSSWARAKIKIGSIKASGSLHSGGYSRSGSMVTMVMPCS